MFRVRLQTTFAALSTRCTCQVGSLDPQAVTTTAPPLEENHVLTNEHLSLPTLALDVTEPSGRHLKTCHLSVGAPAPFHLAVPSKPLSPGIRVGVDRMRPSGDPDDEN